jgi:hypothetical protein
MMEKVDIGARTSPHPMTHALKPKESRCGRW